MKLYFSYSWTVAKLTGTSLATRSIRDACALIFNLDLLFFSFYIQSSVTRFVIVEFVLSFVSDNWNYNFLKSNLRFWIASQCHSKLNTKQPAKKYKHKLAYLTKRNILIFSRILVLQNVSKICFAEVSLCILRVFHFRAPMWCDGHEWYFIFIDGQIKSESASLRIK